MRKVTYPVPMTGECPCCKAPDIKIHRTFFHYDNIKCECHSPNHFEMFEHCENCQPKEPGQTTVLLYTRKIGDIPGFVNFRDKDPLLKDLPFVTRDAKGNYHLWEDSDWFLEVSDSDRSKHKEWMSLPKERK